MVPTKGLEMVLSVIVPVYNEVRTIEKILERIRAVDVEKEIVIVDDFSTDGTRDVLKEIEKAPDVRVFYHDRNRGKGAAIRASLSLVEEPVVVFMDADGSHDPADIPRLAAPIVDGAVDLCVGSRFTGGSEELSITIGQLIRTIGNISMNIAINRRWRVELTDTLNGFRAVRREAALEVGLSEDIHTIEQEMVMKMLLAGHRVMNIPTHEYSRQHGESHIRIWRQWPRFVWCVIKHLVAVNRPSSERSRTSTDSS
ncbi:MAG: glycosyltransferase family 2 protein [Thermoanaerobaculales bacterium]|nr:glycosyltransferase family 2 protein [Thermoanaerobaculales bacterium]